MACSDAVGNYFACCEEGHFHAQWIEQPFAGGLFVRLASDNFNDTPRDIEACIIVVPDSAKRSNLGQIYAFSDGPSKGITPGTGIKEEVADPPTCMSEQVTEGDALRDIRISQSKIRKICAHGGVKVELACLNEAHNDGGCESLGSRPYLEEGIFSDREWMFNVGDAEGGHMFLIAIDDPYSHAWDVETCHLFSYMNGKHREEVITLLGTCFWHSALLYVGIKMASLLVWEQARL